MDICIYTPGKKIPGECSVIALGFFDGVHIAHRKLLKRAKSLATRLGLEFTVFTFPSENSLFKDESRLYSTEDKLDIIRSLGADRVIIADFKDISEISAEDFVRKSLFGDMNCRGAVVGYDFRFGKSRGGDALLLKNLLDELGGICEIEDEVKMGKDKVSSTGIKNLLLNGDAEGAAALLGLPYFVTGNVEHGRGVGRKLGFPTVNYDFNERIPPLKKGVYRTVSTADGRIYNSVTNVGTCPTFEGIDFHIETHLIDFQGDLYGKKIRTYFLGYLREEMRFESEKELIMQIEVDKIRTITENGESKWQEIGLSLQ